MAQKNDNSDFASQWKSVGGDKLDSYERLKEMRTLVAKGAVTQEVYEEAHRYVLEQNLSEKDKKKIKKQTSNKPKPKFEQKPLMEGHLYKRSSKGNQQWKKRYCKLYPDKMEFYTRRTDTEPKTTLLLTKDWYAADNILKRIKNSRRFGFMLSDFAQSVYLAAGSPEDKTYWMHTIARVLRKLKESDRATDHPQLMGQKPRTKSLEDREYKQRMDAYRRLNGTTEAAKKAHRKSLEKIQKSNNTSRKKSLIKAAAAESKHTSMQPIPLPDDTPEESVSGKNKKKNKDKNKNKASATKAEQDDEEEDDGVPQLGGRVISKAFSETIRVESTRIESERASKAQSIASAAMSASESARLSVQSNLGLDVMSFDEQEQLREQAQEAERVKFMKNMENEAAMAEIDQVIGEEQRLKKQLKEARKAGEDEKAKALEPEYARVKLRLAEAEDTAIRTAAERAEAEEVAEQTGEVIAQANAANAIVLELAKIDEAILRAEQLADNAESQRKRAQDAAQRVKDEAAKEAKEKEKALAEAEAAAKKAEKEEELRLEQERKLAAQLEELAAQELAEKQKQKIEEMAQKAAIARAEAEERRFQAELRATQLEMEKIDAMAKAAAVEKALAEAQAMVEQNRTNQGMEAFGFAALRREKEDMHAEAAQRRSIRPTSNSRPGKSEEAKKRKSSFMNRLRRSSSRSSKPALDKKGRKSLKKQRKSLKKKQEKEKEQQQKHKTVVVKDQEPGPQEASSAFMSFFNQFTEGMTEGVEYLTGFRLGETDDDASTFYTYDELDDDDLLSESDFSSSDEEYDDMFDEQLRSVGESERMRAAAAWVEYETARLLDIIEEIGYEDEYGRKVVTFGDLLEVYKSLNDTLVGLLMRAKSSGQVYYEGDMLFELENEHTEITKMV